MIVFTKAEQLEVFVDENLTLCLLLHPIAFLSPVVKGKMNLQHITNTCLCSLESLQCEELASSLTGEMGASPINSIFVLLS